MLENRVIGAREPDSSVLATSCKAGHIGRATGAIGTSCRGGASVEFGAGETRALTEDTSVEVEPGPHCGLGRGISAAPFTKGLTAAARHAAREIRAVWIGAIGVAAMTARELGEAARPLAFVVGAPALVTIGRYGRAAPLEAADADGVGEHQLDVVRSRLKTSLTASLNILARPRAAVDALSNSGAQPCPLIADRSDAAIADTGSRRAFLGGLAASTERELAVVPACSEGRREQKRAS